LTYANHEKWSIYALSPLTNQQLILAIEATLFIDTGKKKRAKVPGMLLFLDIKKIGQKLQTR